MSEQELPPAGWYDDPDGGEGQRYWTGKKWDDKRRGTSAGQTGGGGKTYEVEVLKHSFWTGSLSQGSLETILNRRAQSGWKLSRTVLTDTRVLLFFSRTSVYLIFERA